MNYYGFNTFTAIPRYIFATQLMLLRKTLPDVAEAMSGTAGRTVGGYFLEMVSNAFKLFRSND